jgi:hypothetical protein
MTSRRSSALDLLIKMASMCRAPSTLKCIAFCFYNIEMWLWGLKLSANRAPDLKQCFDGIFHKFKALESVGSLVLTSSDSLHLSEGLILLSKCSAMLDLAQARSALFNDLWTVPSAHPSHHSSTCGICMEDLCDVEVRAVKCPGSHIFHSGCLQDFLVFSTVSSCQNFVCCPYCRFKLPMT